MKEIRYKPVGVIHSPFKEAKGTPIQSKAAEGIEGIVEVFQEFAEGMEDLEGFSHIILIYHFHLSNRPSLKVIPYMDERTHGGLCHEGTKQAESHWHLNSAPGQG